MSCAAALLTYLWHYLVARLFYDELLRPLVGRDRTAALALLAVAVLAGLALRRRAR